jgi:hypothetical protein
LTWFRNVLAWRLVLLNRRSGGIQPVSFDRFATGTQKTRYGDDELHPQGILKTAGENWMFGRKTVSAVAALALGLGILGAVSPVAWAEDTPDLVVATQDATKYTYENNVLKVYDGADLTVSMKQGVNSTKDWIEVVRDATASITISGLTMSPEEDPPIALKMDATLNLKLSGTNTLTGGRSSAGVSVRGDATLKISATTSTAKLIANGARGAAGIGGDFGQSCGTITISSGIVEATGGFNSAGIGGASSGSGGTVTISGGTVTAIGSDEPGGHSGAGIGGGSGGADAKVTITGGTVSATGGSGAMDIGTGAGGEQKKSKPVQFTGGTVNLGRNGLNSFDNSSPVFTDVIITGDGAKANGIDGSYDSNSEREIGTYTATQIGGSDAKGDSTGLRVTFDRDVSNPNTIPDFTAQSSNITVDKVERFSNHEFDVTFKTFTASNGDQVIVKPTWPGWKFTTQESVTATVYAKGPVVSDVSLTGLEFGKPFSTKLTTTESRGTVTWAAKDAVAGMKLESDGTLTWTPQEAGSKSFTVLATDDRATTAKEFTASIAQDIPSITLAETNAPTVFGQTALLEATVKDSAGKLINEGSITFKDSNDPLNSTPVPITNGVATLATPGLAVGPHSFTAIFDGSTNYASQTSDPAINLTIGQAAGAAVDTLTATQITGTSVTGVAELRGNTGQSVEYALTNASTAPGDADWQDDPTFTNLKAVTKYTLWARSAGNTNYLPGYATATPVTTDRYDADAKLFHIVGDTQPYTSSPKTVFVNYAEDASTATVGKITEVQFALPNEKPDDTLKPTQIGVYDIWIWTDDTGSLYKATGTSGLKIGTLTITNPADPNGTWPNGDPIYVQGSGIPLVWHIDKDLTLAIDVFVDDEKATAGSAYDLSAGSTVVTIRPQFLDTLNVGTHTLKATFLDGTTAETTFEVKAATNNNPGTGPDAKKPGTKPDAKKSQVPATGAPGLPTWPAAALALILLAAGVTLTRKARRLA